MAKPSIIPMYIQWDALFPTGSLGEYGMGGPDNPKNFARLATISSSLWAEIFTFGLYSSAAAFCSSYYQDDNNKGHEADAAFDDGTGTDWWSNDSTTNNVSYAGFDFSSPIYRTLDLLGIITSMDGAAYNVNAVHVDLADVKEGPWERRGTFSLNSVKHPYWTIPVQYVFFDNPIMIDKRCIRFVAASESSSHKWRVTDFAMMTRMKSNMECNFNEERGNWYG